MTMTTVTIQDYCGISASFELGVPLCLICGPNGAGKSRIADALGRVLSGELGARNSKEIAGDGKAIVRLSDGETFRAALWPPGETSVRGDQDAMPKASRWAAALDVDRKRITSPLDLSGKERAQAFADIFKTEPSKKNLADALEKRELSGHLDAVWGTVEISGWDAATKEAEANARALKAAWGEVTGATWGERVGETWEPDAKHFSSEEKLTVELRRAEEDLEHAKETLEAAKKERDDLPEAQEAQKVYECAHCGKPNVMQFGKLEKASDVEPLSSQARKDARMAIASADGKIAHAQDQIYHHERAVGAAKARLQDVAEAKTKAAARAAELHQQITEQLEIAAVCGPKGLRKAKLEHVLTKVNESLAALAKEIGLGLVEVDAELEVTMDGTAYRRLSRAEAWICRAVMQIEIARRDGSSMIVIDDLDVPIDPKDRNAVLQALYASGLKAVVMLAARSPEQRYAPDLAAAGIGVTYWLDRQHGLRPISEAQQEQKAA